METMKKYVNKTLEGITSVLFLVMVAVTSWQVISRYVLNSPSTSTEEFLRFSLIWLSMLGAAYVVGKKGHIAFTLLSDRLKSNRRKIVHLVIEIAFLAFAAAIMVYGGGRAVSITMGQISPSLQLPMGYVYLSLPVSGILVMFYSLCNVVELLSGKQGQIISQDENVSGKDDKGEGEIA
jgi:TRAP-type C4-dicarboxylate transport system permease small subunit